VRINPYELHVNDPDFYDTVYAGGGKKRDKYSRFVRLFGMADGALATVDHDLHRVRRAAINPFFSKSNVRKLEGIIKLKSSRVLAHMTALEGSGKPLRLTHLYGAFTSDVIVEYAFGESHNDLAKSDLNANFFQMMGSIHHVGAAAKQIWWLLPLLLSIPESITTRLDPGMAAFASMQNVGSRRHRFSSPLIKS
jgi:cytochrome P450